jgi:hypothetical protein
MFGTTKAHPIDEDLSLHPSEQKSLAGDPGAPRPFKAARCWGSWSPRCPKARHLGHPAFAKNTSRSFDFLPLRAKIARRGPRCTAPFQSCPLLGFVVSQVPKSEAPGAPSFCKKYEQVLRLPSPSRKNRSPGPRCTAPFQSCPLLGFVVSQVPKSEAPGAPSFCKKYEQVLRLRSG